MVHLLDPDSPDPKKRKLYANPNQMSYAVIVQEGVTEVKGQFGFIGEEPMILLWTNSKYPVPIPLSKVEEILISGWSDKPIKKVEDTKGEEE